MSKSYGNTIDIFEDEQSLKKKVMRIKTDSTPVEAPKDPNNCNLFALYKLFAEKEKIDALRQRYLEGGLGYGEVKKELYGLIYEYFSPYRKKREELARERASVREILKRGAEKTRAVAVQTLDEVKRKTGLYYI
jgi:tryptophanyl-tRNA synthetase